MFFLNWWRNRPRYVRIEDLPPDSQAYWGRRQAEREAQAPFMRAALTRMAEALKAESIPLTAWADGTGKEGEAVSRRRVQKIAADPAEPVSPAEFRSLHWSGQALLVRAGWPPSRVMRHVDPEGKLF